MRQKHSEKALRVHENVEPVWAVGCEEADRTHQFAAHITLVDGAQVERAVR